MREYIKKLQSKSEESRKSIMVVSLIVAMFFVGAIWVGSFNYKFNGNSKVVKEEAEGTKPFALFGETINDTYKSITASVGSIPSIKNNEVENIKEIIEDEGNQIDLIPVINQ
jgi:hypothetical protein